MIQADDPVLTCHDYTMIDSGGMEHVEKKTYSLSPLREEASKVLVKRV